MSYRWARTPKFQFGIALLFVFKVIFFWNSDNFVAFTFRKLSSTDFWLDKVFNVKNLSYSIFVTLNTIQIDTAKANTGFPRLMM